MGVAFQPFISFYRFAIYKPTILVVVLLIQLQFIFSIHPLDSRSNAIRYRPIEDSRDATIPFRFRRCQDFVVRLIFFGFLPLIKYGCKWPSFFHTRRRSPVQCVSQGHDKRTCRLFFHTVVYAERRAGSCEYQFFEVDSELWYDPTRNQNPGSTVQKADDQMF